MCRDRWQVGQQGRDLQAPLGRSQGWFVGVAQGLCSVPPSGKGLPRKAGCLRGLCPRLPLGAAGLGCPRSAGQARRLRVLPSRLQLLWRAGNSVSLARSGCPSVLCSVYGDIRLHVKDMVDVRLLFLINMFVAHFHVNTVNPVPQSSIRAHDQGHLRRGGHQRTTKLKHPCRLVTSQPP